MSVQTRLNCTHIRQLFILIAGDGYIPTYTMTDLTDALHEVFDFRMDYQMKKIFKDTKK